jgi:hypothetical protein
MAYDKTNHHKTRRMFCLLLDQNQQKKQQRVNRRHPMIQKSKLTNETLEEVMDIIEIETTSSRKASRH